MRTRRKSRTAKDAKLLILRTLTLSLRPCVQTLRLCVKQFNFAGSIHMFDSETYEIVVGLEVHAQLLTKSKLFCGDSIAFGAEPNVNVSPITLAHPGVLPKMNRKAVEFAVKLGL